jgi:hypothetical protein
VGIVSEISDLEWIEAQPEPEVPAAKLHVLRLGPIKDRLGDKWDKLSALVHKLFEKALRNIQGPSDHFLLVDEMSYVVTFNNLSLEAASLACAGVAKEVSELLFGADVDDISVRGLVALVPRSSLKAMAGSEIAELLERRGGEIVVRRNRASHEDRTVKSAVRETPIGGWIGRAQQLFAKSGSDVALLPVWDLKNRKSASVAVTIPAADGTPVSIRRLVKQADENFFVDHEVALLQAASEYAQRVALAHKMCAVAVGVSYETLSGFHSRIAYIGALKALPTVASCPLLLRIERVPEGTPQGRLAEIVAMLAAPNIRATVEYLSLRDLSELEIRLGAAGLGWAPGADIAIVKSGVLKLAQRAAAQKAFSFMHGIKDVEHLAAARQAGIRFGSGPALGGSTHLGLLDPIPNFPLTG